MKNVFILIALALLPATVFGYQGRVLVHMPLSLNVTNGSNYVAPGTYNFRMSQGSKKLKFEINVAGNNNNPVFNVVSTRPFPTNGAFVVPAALSGQPYDAQGNVRTTISLSNPMWERITCRTQIKKQVCHVLPNGQKECYWKYFWVDGHQDQQFRYRDENRDFAMTLRTPNAGQNAAQFNGNERYSSKDILYKGPCYY